MMRDAEAQGKVSEVEGLSLCKVKLRKKKKKKKRPPVLHQGYLPGTLYEMLERS